MTDREIFRRNLSNLINETKVKQVDIAKYVGISDKTVSAWLAGRGYPRADAMEKLCKFFGVRQSALTEPQDTSDLLETQLLEIFRSMSDIGREKLVERAAELRILYPKRAK